VRAIPVPSERQVNRLWSRLDRSGECWLWSGALNSKGYGHIRIGGRGGRAVGTHQLAFYLTHGYLPSMVLHTCDTPNCCNPDHLFAGTGKANADDTMAKGRGNQPKGERNAHAKLTEDDVLLLRAMKARGEQLVGMAEVFGVAHSVIYNAANGKTWRHIRKDGLT
jgi:hypothetical protein